MYLLRVRVGRGEGAENKLRLIPPFIFLVFLCTFFPPPPSFRVRARQIEGAIDGVGSGDVWRVGGGAGGMADVARGRTLEIACSGPCSPFFFYLLVAGLLCNRNQCRGFPLLASVSLPCPFTQVCGRTLFSGESCEKPSHVFFSSFSPFCLSVSVTSSRRSLTPPFLPTITKQRGSPRLCFLFPSFAASPLPTNKERKKMSAVQLKINIVKLGSVKMIKVRRTLRSTLLTPHAAVVPRRHDRPRSLPRHQGEAW